MIQRCTNPNNPLSEWYYSKGITVTDKWLTFAGFFEDMGERPPGTYLDRIDNSQGYHPDNVRWATRRQSMLNRTFKSRGSDLPRGIRKTKTGYQARMKISGKEYTIGTFRLLEDAIHARRLWEVRHDK